MLSRIKVLFFEFMLEDTWLVRSPARSSFPIVPIQYLEEIGLLLICSSNICLENQQRLRTPRSNHKSPLNWLVGLQISP